MLITREPFKLDNRGQGLTEYLILLMLVAVTCIGISQTLGNTIKTKLRIAKDHINKEISLNN